MVFYPLPPPKRGRRSPAGGSKEGTGCAVGCDSVAKKDTEDSSAGATNVASVGVASCVTSATKPPTSHPLQVKVTTLQLMQQQVAGLRTALLAVQSQHADHSKMAAVCSTVLPAACAKVQSQNQQLAAATADNTELHEQLAAAALRLAVSERNVQDLQQRLMRSEEQAIEKAATVVQLTQQLSAADAAHKHARLNHCRDQRLFDVAIVCVTHALEQQQAETAANKQQVSAAEVRIVQLSEDLAALQANDSARQQLIQQLQQSLQDSEAATTKAVRVRDSVIEQQAAIIEQLQEQVQAYAHAETSHEQQFHAFKQQLAAEELQLGAQAAADKAALQKLTEELKQQVKTNQTLQQQAAESAATIHHLQQQAADNAATIQKLQQQAADNAATSLKLQQQAADNAATIHRLQQQAADNAATIQKLQQQAADNAATSPKLQQQAADNAATIHHLQQQAADSAATIQKLQQQAADTSQHQLVRYQGPRHHKGKVQGAAAAQQQQKEQHQRELSAMQQAMDTSRPELAAAADQVQQQPCQQQPETNAATQGHTGFVELLQQQLSDSQQQNQQLKALCEQVHKEHVQVVQHLAWAAKLQRADAEDVAFMAADVMSAKDREGMSELAKAAVRIAQCGMLELVNKNAKMELLRERLHGSGLIATLDEAEWAKKGKTWRFPRVECTSVEHEDMIPVLLDLGMHTYIEDMDEVEAAVAAGQLQPGYVYGPGVPLNAGQQQQQGDEHVPPAEQQEQQGDEHAPPAEQQEQQGKFVPPVWQQQHVFEFAPGTDVAPAFDDGQQQQQQPRAPPGFEHHRPANPAEGSQPQPSLAPVGQQQQGQRQEYVLPVRGQEHQQQGYNTCSHLFGFDVGTNAMAPAGFDQQQHAAYSPYFGFDVGTGADTPPVFTHEQQQQHQHEYNPFSHLSGFGAGSGADAPVFEHEQQQQQQPQYNPFGCQFGVGFGNAAEESPAFKQGQQQQQPQYNPFGCQFGVGFGNAAEESPAFKQGQQQQQQQPQYNPFGCQFGVGSSTVADASRSFDQGQQQQQPQYNPFGCIGVGSSTLADASPACNEGQQQQQQPDYSAFGCQFGWGFGNAAGSQQQQPHVPPGFDLFMPAYTAEDAQQQQPREPPGLGQCRPEYTAAGIQQQRPCMPPGF